jgi:hypothetical protein
MKLCQALRDPRYSQTHISLFVGCVMLAACPTPSSVATGCLVSAVSVIRNWNVSIRAGVAMKATVFQPPFPRSGGRLHLCVCALAHSALLGRGKRDPGL